MTSPTTGREVRLAGRPAGVPGPELFHLAESPVPDLADGQILVRNTWMSVDPYMRGRLEDAPSYLPPFELGRALEGSALGTVIASKSPAVSPGTTVVHSLGWRDLAVLEASAAAPVDLALASPEAYLGVLGLTGLSAYLAVTEVAAVRPGDTVFVSGAAGAVGSVAGQLARRAGAARVIGSAGGPAKAELVVREFGFDTALDYRAAPIADQLAAAAPDGIDVYIDNVGGDHLTAALSSARRGARFALVGAISGYNATAPVPGPPNLFRAYWQEVTLRGLLISHHFHRFPEWIAEALPLLKDGSLHTRTTVVDGLDRAAEAFLGVLRGDNTGKMLVRLP